jgi:hypothetical protein
VTPPGPLTTAGKLVTAFGTRIQPGLEQARGLSVGAGLIALLALGVVGEGKLADRPALIALVAIGFATLLGWLQIFIPRRPHSPREAGVSHRTPGAWLVVTIGVAILASLAVHTWFQAGSSIASGDIPPPDGTAWLGRIFEPWTWSGSDLGGPSQLALQLPWAAVLSIGHTFGGDPALAQRMWYTILFTGAALAALALFAALRMSPTAALVGTAVYVLSPYVVSEVTINPVYLAALGLLAAIPAPIVAAGTGRLSVRWGAVLVAMSAPLIGYVDLNPPLVGMLLGAVIATPLVVRWVDGREAGWRSFRTVLLAAPLLLAASAYWVVPSFLHLSNVVTDQLAPVATWSWTEARATVQNAFWLNTFWGWPFPEYFAYANSYEKLPLSIARFVLPAIAFSALALAVVSQASNRRPDRLRRFRLAVAAATAALTIIFLSTGTNPPGEAVFNRLYHLPLGWLLREPGRFLMVASLAYAVLVAIVIDELVQGPVGFKPAVRGWLKRPGKGVVPEATGIALALEKLAEGQSAGLSSSRGSWGKWPRMAAAPVILGLVLIMGFPVFTGAVVPDARPTLPSAHVRMPGYWPEMARFVDGLPMQGALLVMPPDDFYAMPYSWGYYGTDDFVVNLFHRSVLIPNGQGYSPATTQVVSSVDLVAQSILAHNWNETQALISALNTPLILVRGDIKSPFGSRPILPPADLAASLRTAPNFELVRRIGELELFQARSQAAEFDRVTDFVTVNTQTPDLRLLALLPTNTALVSIAAQAGKTYALEAPPYNMWQDNGDSVVWQPDAPLGSTYRMADVQSQSMVALGHNGTFTIGQSNVRVAYTHGATGDSITASLKVRSAIVNGDFAHGLWGPVMDCHAAFRTPATRYVSGVILPRGAPGSLPALRLSASVNSACVDQPLRWQGGQLILSLMTRAVQGGPSRFCLWEVGPQRCATLPAIGSTLNWSRYRATFVPDAGTTALDLILYADASAGLTVNDYADVRAVEVPTSSSDLVLVAEPEQPTSSVELVIWHSTYSTNWQGSNEGRHVLVDGMLNGWLVSSGSPTFSVAYGPDAFVTAGKWMSIGALLIALLLVFWDWIAKMGGRINSGLVARNGRRSNIIQDSRSRTK